jgi:hypothetical protein
MLSAIWNLLINLPGLLKILKKAPAAITVLKAIMDIAGSEAVKEILRLVYDVVQSFKDEKPAETASMTVRTRFVDRLRERLGQRMLRITEQQYTAMKNVFHENAFTT